MIGSTPVMTPRFQGRWHPFDLSQEEQVRLKAAILISPALQELANDLDKIPQQSRQVYSFDKMNILPVVINWGIFSTHWGEEALVYFWDDKGTSTLGMIEFEKLKTNPVWKAVGVYRITPKNNQVEDVHALRFFQSLLNVKL